MKDDYIPIKGWPSELGLRRSRKISRWHSEWLRRQEHDADPRPEGRTASSGSSSQHLDENSPQDAVSEYKRRALEIGGRDPETQLDIPEPDAHERFRGALLAAAIGDAYGAAVSAGTVHELPWKPIPMLGDKVLTEYALRCDAIRPSAVTQMSAFTLEGLIRAHVARRLNPVDNDPVPEVQHAYQRWLHTQLVGWGKQEQWRVCGGPYASKAVDPDGWLVRNRGLFTRHAPNQGVVGVLTGFARTGVRSTLRNRIAAARGGDVVPRSAIAAVWANELPEAFSTAVGIAALTHGDPNDYLAAGTLAAVLHQQIRGIPFSACMGRALRELKRWPGSEKTSKLVRRTAYVIKNDWTPVNAEHVREEFGEGSDGAEALAMSVYIGLASDYVREALLLAMNYTANRSVVGAISGMLIGADFGVQAIPEDLRSALELWDVIEALSNDALAEFSPGPPNDPSWTQRYPAW